MSDQSIENAATLSLEVIPGAEQNDLPEGTLYARVSVSFSKGVGYVAYVHIIGTDDPTGTGNFQCIPTSDPRRIKLEAAPRFNRKRLGEIAANVLKNEDVVALIATHPPTRGLRLTEEAASRLGLAYDPQPAALVVDEYDYDADQLAQSFRNAQAYALEGDLA